MLLSTRLIGSLTLTVALLATATGMAQDKKKEVTVTGSWSVTVKGHGAHGDLTAGLTLTQEGNNVTGLLSAHGHDHSVEGKFIDRTLELATIQSHAGRQMTLTATLTENGTLTGNLSGPDGDLQWTAERVNAK